MTLRVPGDLCKLGLLCCSVGLRKPVALCKGRSHLGCCIHSMAFPEDKLYVPFPVCALLFLQCKPNCGCCMPPQKHSKSCCQKFGGAPGETETDAELDDAGTYVQAGAAASATEAGAPVVPDATMER